jgi:hypothetical protein
MRNHVSAELRARIGLMTASGKRQKAIAETLGISVHRVSRTQIMLKINPRRGLKRTRRQREKIIRAMTKKRASQSAIAKRVGMTRVGVWRAQQRLGLKQFVPDRVYPSQKTERMIVALLRARIPHSHIEVGLRIGLKKIKGIALRHRIPWHKKEHASRWTN